MAVDCTCGTSFHLRGHLYVVVAELPGPPEEFVVVNLTSKKPTSDTTVVLQSDDHPFIKHDTVVNYFDARTFLRDDLINRIEQRFFAKDEPFSTATLKVIQQGLLDSPHTPRYIKKLCAVVFT